MSKFWNQRMVFKLKASSKKSLFKAEAIRLFGENEFDQKSYQDY